MGSNTIARLSVISVGVLAMAGCSFIPPPIPTPEELFCTWSSVTDDGEVVLFPDNTLKYDNLVLAVVQRPDGTDQSIVSGYATWSYGLDFRDRAGRPSITLQLEDTDWIFYVSGSGDSMRLINEVGPPEREPDGYAFEKSSCSGDPDWIRPVHQRVAEAED